MSASTTRAPSSAKSSAVARPIPAAAPVTTATRSASRVMCKTGLLVGRTAPSGRFYERKCPRGWFFLVGWPYTRRLP